MLTLDKFEEASKIVTEVTHETKLVYSDYFSEKCGNMVYLKPENMQLTGAYKLRGAYYKSAHLQMRREQRDLLQHLLVIMPRVLHMQLANMA